MRIIISNKSEMPIYAQIKKQIKEHILKGEIKQNEFLPSIRQLARDLSVSVITTTRAYQELENEGFISSIQGKGSIVLPQDTEMIKEQYLMKIERCFQEGIDLGKMTGINERELENIFENLIKGE